jgi:hypothetical protein
MTTPVDDIVCPYHENPTTHKSANCRQRQDNRYKFAKEHNMCVKCTKVGHKTQECPSDELCIHCHSPWHHHSLCKIPEKEKPTQSQTGDTKFVQPAPRIPGKPPGSQQNRNNPRYKGKGKQPHPNNYRNKPVEPAATTEPAEEKPIPKSILKQESKTVTIVDPKEVADVFQRASRKPVDKQ